MIRFYPTVVSTFGSRCYFLIALSLLALFLSTKPAAAQTPQLQSISRYSPTAPNTTSTSMEFRLNFSRPVAYLDTTDLEFTGTVAAQASFDNIVRQNDSSFVAIAQVNSPSTGTLGLNLKGADGTGTNNIVLDNSQLAAQSLANQQVTNSTLIGQSFVPTVTGNLYSIALQYGLGHNYTGPMTMSLLTGSGFGGTVVNSVNTAITSTTLSTDHVFYFDGPVPVTSGATYTLRLDFPNGATVAIAAQTGNPYGQGILYQPAALAIADLYFKARVLPPPTTPLGSNVPTTDEQFTFVVCDLSATNSVSTPAGCDGSSGGQATLNVSGGNPPYTYNWMNGDTTATGFNLPAGLNSVSITDSLGCTLTETVSVDAFCEIVVKGNNQVIGFGDTVPSLSDSTQIILGPSGGSDTVTYWVVNQTNAAINLSAPTITGPDAGQFTLLAPPATSINGGDSTAFTLIGTAPAIGNYTADITIANTGSTTNPYTFRVEAVAAHNGFDFSGPFPYVSVPDDPTLDFTNTFTLEAWVNPDFLSTSGLITKFGNGSSNRAFALLLLSSGQLEFSISQNGSSETFLTSSQGISAGMWSHVAAVYDGAHLRIYINGVENNNTQVASFNVFNSSQALLIGARDNGSVSNFFFGRMDEVRIWNVARSGAELNAHKNCMIAPNSSGLAAYYDFNQGVPNGDNTGIGNLMDVSGNGNNGVLTNALLTGTTANFVVGAVDSIPGSCVAPISVSANALDTIPCNGDNSGTLTAVVTGGATPYTFAWSSGATSDTATGLGAGTYTVTITDALGTTATASTGLNEPNAIIAATTLDSTVSCNGLLDGGASATATGGTSPYTYVWSNTATTASINGVGASIYSVTITDNNGCTDSTSVVITEPTALTANTAISAFVFCNGFTNGGVAASASGGTAPYTYNWSNGANTDSISSLGAGTYSVTVTDANGCTDSTAQLLTEPAAIVLTTSVISNVSCNGLADGAATVTSSTGSNPASYTWSNGATTQTITGLTAGVYTLTFGDGTGCVAIDSVTITEPVALVGSATVDSNATCNGLANGGASAAPTGGTSPYTYAWSNAATTASITGVGAGTYSVTITDNNGCTDSTSIVITEPTALTANTAISAFVFCNGFTNGGVAASASGGTGPFTYNWSNGANTDSISSLGAGTYSVTVTDANGCTDSTAQPLTEPAAIVLTTSVISNVSCNGLADGAATVTSSTGSNPASYTWSNGATTQTITGLTAGVYTLTFGDGTGCVAIDSVIITEPVALVSSATVDSNASCNGLLDGGASAAPTGGTSPYTFVWSNSATTASITGVGAGTYSVTITDANGCTDSTSIVITEPTALVAAAVLDSNATCNGLANGGASAAANGGTGTYTYAWSNTATTASITGVGAGVYSVTITDANGCTNSTSIAITEPTALVATAVLDSNVTCNGLTNGGASATATGGTGTYSYAWSNTATTASISGVAAGVYSVTITDANGCTNSTSIAITEPTALVAAAVLDSNVTCNGLTNGGASATATGGTGAYAYAWSNAATTASITGVGAGTYSVTITDANGCSDTAQVLVSEPSLLTLNLLVATDVSCAGDSNGTAEVLASGGTSPYQYQWSNGNVTGAISSLQEGTYTVIVTDSNGCTDSLQVGIGFQFSLPIVNLGPDIQVTDPQVVLAVPDTFTSYQWSTGSTDSSALATTNGPVWLVASDQNGCSGTDTVLVSLWPTGIAPQPSASGWMVYPNPAKDWLAVDTRQLKSGVLQWNLYNLNGQSVVRGQLVTGTSTPQRISLPNLPAGVYLLEGTHGTQHLMQRIIIH